MPPTFTLAEHLEELRRRLGIGLGALLLATWVSFSQVERIILWLYRPAEWSLSRLAFFSPTEPLLAYVRVAVLSGLLLSMPVMLGQLWGFVRGGLTARERGYGAWLIGWGSLQCLLGAAFAYYALLPVSLRFLLGIGRWYLEPVISLDRYLSFVTTLIFWSAVVFELPVVLFVLAKAGVVTSEWLRQQRRYAILVLVVLSALVTPTTDPVSLMLMAVPLMALYELSIWITRAAIRAPAPASSRRAS